MCDVRVGKRGSCKGFPEIGYNCNGVRAELCWAHWVEVTGQEKEPISEWIKRRCIKRRRRLL